MGITKEKKKYNFIEMSRRQYVVGLIIVPLYFFMLRYLIINPALKFFFSDNDAINYISGPIKSTIIMIVLVVLLHNIIIKSFKNLVESKFIENLKWIFLSFAIILGIKVVYVIVSMILKTLLSERFSWIFESQTKNEEVLDNLGRISLVFLMVFTILVAPIVEELIFRYVLYHWLRKVNVHFAIIVSSIIFAGLHVIGYIGSTQYFQGVYYFIDYMAGAIVITVLYEKRRNILFCIMLHMLINIISKV